MRGGIADVTVHDVWSVDNSDGKIILNHNPFGKIGSAFVWESAPGQPPDYSGWVMGGGSNGHLGLSDGQIEETYNRNVDVMREGAGLDFLMPTALLHYKKGMFAPDILGIMHDPALVDTKLGACTSSPQPEVEPCHYKWSHREAYDDHESNGAFETATPIAFGPVQNLNLDHSGDRSYDLVQGVYYSSNDDRWHPIWWHTDDVDYYRVQSDGDYKLGVSVFVQDGYSLRHRLVVDGIEVTAGTTPEGISKWMKLEVQAKTKHLIMFTGDASYYRMYVAPVPTADDLIFATNEDNEVSIPLTGSEHSGLTTTFSVADRPSHGRLVGSPPTVTYVPNWNFHGHDQFSYLAWLGMFSSEPAIVSIDVLSINDPPVAYALNVTVPNNIPTTIQLRGVDPDDNWEPVSMFKIVEQPTTGKLEKDIENLEELRVNYVPKSGFTGIVAFKYIVSDGELWSDPKTVTINVVSG
jgi:hypothetical protein